jgi:hypothetical protein
VVATIRLDPPYFSFVRVPQRQRDRVESALSGSSNLPSDPMCIRSSPPLMQADRLVIQAVS